MPTLAQLVDDRATVTYGEPPDALTIDYHPRQLTTVAALKLARDLGNFEQASADIDAVIDLLSRLVRSLCDAVIGWDLCEADGETVMPITPERLEREDITTLASIYGALMQDSRRGAGLGEPTGTRSPMRVSGTHARAAKSTTSQAGASRSKSR